MEYQNRKINRLKNYDYSSNGLYFVTICTKDRVRYLSEIICDDEFYDNFDNPIKNDYPGENVGDGVLDVPYVKFKKYGEITNEIIIQINEFYSNINILNYVIMPDHLHMIISIFDNDKIIGGTSRTPSPTNAIIPSFISTLKRFVNKRIGFNIWQRSYFDHIIRNENELRDIWNYIENNPINWINHIYDQNFWR